ncbi:uncharacterized protein LOC143821894 [Paroedura picta]|uniref:uncharacterized protein LOC143821894 n=1 Tax=Paroedura picta TaxID=143630 RepID=UPI0040566C6F
MSRYDDPTVEIEWGLDLRRGFPDQEAMIVMENIDLRDRMDQLRDWLTTMTGKLGEESQRDARFFLAELRHPVLISEEGAAIVLPDPRAGTEGEAVPVGAVGIPRPDARALRRPPPPGDGAAPAEPRVRIKLAEESPASGRLEPFSCCPHPCFCR